MVDISGCNSTPTTDISTFILIYIKCRKWQLAFGSSFFKAKSQLISNEPNMSNQQEEDTNVELWKVKKLIKNLEAARGNGTSMISLILPPKDQISRAVKMLADEYGTASNIKSRVNRQSVLDAITSTQQRLKLFTRVPKNGLIIYWYIYYILTKVVQY